MVRDSAAALYFDALAAGSTSAGTEIQALRMRKTTRRISRRVPSTPPPIYI
jgi:hypothetical protein